MEREKGNQEGIGDNREGKGRGKGEWWGESLHGEMLLTLLEQDRTIRTIHAQNKDTCNRSCGKIS